LLAYAVRTLIMPFSTVYAALYCFPLRLTVTLPLLFVHIGASDSNVFYSPHLMILISLDPGKHWSGAVHVPPALIHATSFS
jgi:hypothetical protein